MFQTGRGARATQTHASHDANVAFTAVTSSHPVVQSPLQRGHTPSSVATGSFSQDRGHLLQHVSGLGAALVAARLVARRRQRGGKVKRLNSQSQVAYKPAQIRKYLWEMERQVPSLMRFLNEDTSLSLDFAKMEPYNFAPGESLEVGGTNKTPVSIVNEWKQAGLVRQIDFTLTKTPDDNYVVLCTCNADAGMVCGLGLDSAMKRAKHAAAKQLLDRIVLASNVLQELSRASPDYEIAKHVAETCDAMGHLIKNLGMTVMQPCGTRWKAFMKGEFQGYKIFGLSRMCDTREEAVAAAGDTFYHQLRAKLRIPKDELHAPEEWAKALEYETTKQSVELGQLGIEDVQTQLLEALREGEDSEKLTAALEEAMKRQEARCASVNEENQVPDEDVTCVVARRVYEVTKPEDEDWRREEIKGKLPAEQIREELSKALEYKQTVVVSGGTGSGKSTQLPQFILDDFRSWEVEGPSAEEPPTLEVDEIVEVEFEDVWYACTIQEVADDKSTITAKYHEGGDVEGDIVVKDRVRKAKPRWAREVPRIVVTQPRRIAAVTLAQRVAWERFGEVGGEIGHAIRGDSIFPNSDSGTVEFCTVGTLLKRLISDPQLGRYNVVILDEVHERDLMTDFLLVLLKEVIKKRPDLRLVLMSATLDVQTFVNYLPGCGVVEVPTGTRYPVEEIHLDDPFFEEFKETRGMLTEEAEARESAGAVTGSGGQHNFGVSEADTDQEAVKEALLKEVSILIESDEDAQRQWEAYCDALRGGEQDPAQHPVENLRNFLKQAGEGEAPGAPDEEAEPPSAVLAEQIQQVASYSDQFREAWVKCVKEREGDEPPQEWESSELLAFLTEQGVRPWKVDLASWEVISSSPWWGNDTNNSTFVSLAERVIMKVVPEMLEVPADDEFGTGAILCFLPGWAEIKKLASNLEASENADRLWVLKLHSSVSKEDQQQVFETAPEGKVKVILATNIAESSVTINDVRVVVDSGLHREVTYDPKRRLSSMETVWICQSNAVQRKGRAGRVREGRVFRLYSRDQFEYVPWRPAPEIQRCNLANTCLSTIALGRDPREFLAKAPDPPMVANLESAMSELSSIEAIQDGVPPKMLPVGEVLSRIPLEPLLGRAMMLGTLFGVPQMSAAMLTASAGASPFVSTPDKRDQALATMREYCEWSDPVCSLRALTEFEQVFKERGEMLAREWADYYFLNYQRLVNMSRIKFQLLVDAQRSGLLSAADTEGVNPEEWMSSEEGGEEGRAFWEDASAGAIMEASEINKGLSHVEWMEELRNSNREVEDERLLVGILCHAYPTNLAVRHKRNHFLHTTANGSKAIIDNRSVNMSKKSDDGNLTSWLPEPSWWLYGDMRMFNRQLGLSDTTYVSNWNLALFAGLSEQELSDNELELNGWIGLQGVSDDTNELVRRLRLEIRQALSWVAIAASWDRIATAATIRAKTLLRVLGRVLMGGKPAEEDLKFIREWRVPEETGATLQAEEVESREDVEQKLWAKTVAEIKVLLREMGGKVSGRKMELVKRCADYLMYGEEREEEQWGEEE